MKFTTGVVAGVLVAVLGQWVLKSTPDVTAASARATVAWGWAQHAAKAELWPSVALLGGLALLALGVTIATVHQDDFCTEHLGWTIGLAGVALTAALGTVVATARGRLDGATGCALICGGLVAWAVRRARDLRRAFD